MKHPKSQAEIKLLIKEKEKQYESIGDELGILHQQYNDLEYKNKYKAGMCFVADNTEETVLGPKIHTYIKLYSVYHSKLMYEKNRVYYHFHGITVKEADSSHPEFTVHTGCIDTRMSEYDQVPKKQWDGVVQKMLKQISKERI